MLSLGHVVQSRDDTCWLASVFSERNFSEVYQASEV